MSVAPHRTSLGRATPGLYNYVLGLDLVQHSLDWEGVAVVVVVVGVIGFGELPARVQ